MCQILDVSRSGFYDWLKRSASEHSQQDGQLIEMIKTIFQQGRSNYGTRQIKKVLAKEDQMVSRRRIGRLMQEAGLFCKTKRRFKAVRYEPHDQPVAANLLNRQFKTDKPNQVYVGDITYLPTLEGWLYLAVVIDVYSRRVVGWSMADHMRTQLVNDALMMAIWQRKIEVFYNRERQHSTNGYWSPVDYELLQKVA